MFIKRKIKIGDRYAIIPEGHHNSDEIIKVLYVEVDEKKYLDSQIHYRTKELVHRKKNHVCRAWWIYDACLLVSQENRL